MESLRVQGLSSGMLLELAGGTPYYFGIYESQLKSSLNFTQSQIDTVSSTGNLALYLSVEGGLLIDILGPKFLGCVAALLNFGGYFLLYQVVRGKVGASVGRVAAYVAIWQHGAGFMDNIAVVLTLKNFKHDSGKTIGLLKSFFGLSAAVFSCFTSNLLSMTTNKDGDEEQDLNQLFLFLTIVPCLLIALAFPGAKILPKDIGLSRIGNKERRLINIGYIIVILTTVYVTVVKLLQSQDVIGQSVVLGVCLLPFLVAIFSPALRSWGGLVSSCTTGSLRGSTKTAEPSVDKENNEDSLMEPLVEVAEGSDSVGIDNNASFFASIKNSKLAQSVTKNFDAWHAVIEINFWLLFISSTVGFGAGLMIINNIGDISKAIDISDDSVFVTMISVGNCCGRMFFGFSSDFFIHRISRPGFLLIAYLLMVVGFGLLAFTQQAGLLYVVTPIVGFSYGGFFALGVALFNDLYKHKKNTGTIYALFSLSAALGSFIFSQQIFPWAYDRHSRATGIESNDCDAGSKCFRDAALVTNAALLFAAMLLAVLTFRTRKLYSTAA